MKARVRLRANAEALHPSSTDFAAALTRTSFGESVGSACELTTLDQACFIDTDHHLFRDVLRRISGRVAKSKSAPGVTR
jgi:hypothetical protein